MKNKIKSMIRNKAINLLLFAILFSCNNESLKDSENSVFQPIITLDGIEPLPITDKLIIDDIVLIEQSKGCFIGQIDKIKVVNNTFYILDINVAGTLLAFDDAGNFKFQISKKGKGKGEYVGLKDFFVGSDFITVLTSNPSKKMTFNMNGDFQKSSKLDFRAQNLFVVDENKVIYEVSPLQNKHYFYLENEGEIIEKQISIFSSEERIPSKALKSELYSGFYEVDGKIKVRPTMSNKVYAYNGSEMILDYSFDFKDLSPSYDKYLDDENMIQSFHCFENNSYLLATYYIEGQALIFIKNKITGDLINTPLDFGNDLPQVFTQLLTRTIYAGDDYFIAKITPTLYENWKYLLANTSNESHPLPNQVKLEKLFSRDIHVPDEPLILVKYHLSY